MELLVSVRHALRADSPAVLLRTVSVMLDLSEPGDGMWFEAPRDPLPRADLLRSFIENSYAETTALLTLIAAMLPAGDAALVEIQAELLHRRHPLPRWIQDVAEGRVEIDVVRMTDIAGDGENCVLGVRFGSGAAFTALVLTDHNLGSAVKHAFLVPAPLDETLGRLGSEALEQLGPEHIGAWDPAIARATVASAIEQGRRTIDMPESEEWPALRPAIEWLLRLLPDGGEPDIPPMWAEEELAALRVEFLASEEGQGVDDVEDEFCVSMILSFGNGYNVGGPLRWSPAVAEIFLLDWMPRKVMVPFSDVERMPSLLGDFVRFAHRRQGLDSEFTGEVLEVIASMVEEYGEAMQDEGLADAYEDFEFAEFMLERLDEAVGGREALVALDDEPLPDEDFVWDGIAEDIHERVGEYLALLDSVAEAHLDVEHRTAMRRVLARAALGDPGIFRRRSLVARGAAAIGWAVCRANETAGTFKQGPTVEEAVGWFGVSGNVSQRAGVFLQAIGAPDVGWWQALPLGSADLLVSARRARILEERGRYM